MSKYIPADKLIAEIERLISICEKQRTDAIEVECYDLADDASARIGELRVILETITSLQQEQPETDIKSPFTGGKVAILSRQEEVTFRGEKVKILRKYYRCEDTGREFTDDKLDEDMMWAIFRAYCEKKGMTSFTDIMLKQEQPETPSGEEVMTMCNQILIDWVKEGKTPEEREQREQAHIRFFELYDELQQEQPEVDLDAEIAIYLNRNVLNRINNSDIIEDFTTMEAGELAEHFYELGLNARNVD